MKNEENNTRETIDHLKQIILIKYKLFKFQMAENAARFGASVVTSISAYLVLFLCVIFASIAIAYAVAEYTGYTYLGFAAIAAFYLIIFIALKYVWKRMIRRLLMDFFIKNMFEKNEQ
jgi:hypothetical protein